MFHNICFHYLFRCILNLHHASMSLNFSKFICFWTPASSSGQQSTHLCFISYFVASGSSGASNYNHRGITFFMLMSANFLFLHTFDIPQFWFVIICTIHVITWGKIILSGLILFFQIVYDEQCHSLLMLKLILSFSDFFLYYLCLSHNQNKKNHRYET